jgi:hypothetical protein
MKTWAGKTSSLAPSTTVTSAPSPITATHYKKLSRSILARGHAVSLAEMRMPGAWTLCSLSFVWS